MIKYMKYSFLALVIGGIGFSISGVNTSVAQSTDKNSVIQKETVSQKSNVFNPDDYVGEIVTVVKRGNSDVNPESFREGYLEATHSEKYYCYENRVKIAQKTTHQGSERKTVELSVFLNNEDMRKYIPSEFQSHLQKFDDLEFSFSCEKEAVWVLAKGVSAVSENYEPRSFAFSFFAVPESRNLQKFSME